MSDLEFDGADFYHIEERLNEINRLKDKYGNTIEDIVDAYENKHARLQKLDDYDAYMAELESKLKNQEKILEAACQRLSDIRRKAAVNLTDLLKKALENLNFLSVQFEIAMERKDASEKGFDDVEFLISTNPGEKVKPLMQD